MEPTDLDFEQLLLNYQMDIAFRSEPAGNPSLQSICLYAEPFAMVVPENHFLKEHNLDDLEDLNSEKFILSGLNQRTFYVSSLCQIFADHDFKPKVFIESDFGGMILGLVAKGLGVSILPNPFSFSTPVNVRFINLPYKVSLPEVWRKGDKSPVLKNVLKLVEETVLKYDSDESIKTGK